jgi:hypothetical protein
MDVGVGFRVFWRTLSGIVKGTSLMIYTGFYFELAPSILRLHLTAVSSMFHFACAE